MKSILIALIVLLALLIGIGTSSLIFWGLGSLVIWVFKINYVWTFWHGLVCTLLFLVLKGIFNRK